MRAAARRAQPVVVIHGGSGQRPTRARLKRVRAHLRQIAQEAAACLQTHSALETVVWAVRLLEDDPLFNAGTGSSLQEDGRARMSAAVMDGASLRFAAVLNIEQMRNPVLVAQALLSERDRVLAGPGAIRFARSLGHGVWDPVTLERQRRWQRWRSGGDGHGTVGAIALDAMGALAAATSTGGKGGERAGRVSDSGLPCGNYAGASAAVSCTGIGEDIVDEALAVRIAQRVADGASITQAFARTFRELTARGRRAGAIGMDRRGRIAWDTTLPILLAVAQTPAGRRESF